MRPSRSAILTVHHWDDPGRGLAELCRVAPRRVVLAIDFEIHSRFWLLDEYLPEVGDYVRRCGPDAADDRRGHRCTSSVALPVPRDMEDGVLGAYWCRPEAYLDPAVRANVSGLALADPAVIARGIGRLEADLASGAWHDRHADLLARDTRGLGIPIVGGRGVLTASGARRGRPGPQAAAGGGRWRWIRSRLWNPQRSRPFSWVVGPPSA